MKEESGDFSFQKWGYRFFTNNFHVSLEKWISRENNNIKKVIFYAKDFLGFPAFYGKMEEKYYDSYNDTWESWGVKRNIHFDSHTELSLKENYSIEWCWKVVFTKKRME